MTSRLEQKELLEAERANKQEKTRSRRMRTHAIVARSREDVIEKRLDFLFRAVPSPPAGRIDFLSAKKIRETKKLSPMSSLFHVCV